MKKQDALDLFGGRPVDAARALGVTRQYVNLWDDPLPQNIEDRVVGAYIRLQGRRYTGKPVKVK